MADMFFNINEFSNFKNTIVFYGKF